MIRHKFRLIALLLVAGAANVAYADASNVAGNIQTQGLLLTLMGIFFGGMLVSLTPCVYPMIPITLSIIGARSATSSPLVGFTRSLVFVLGIATIYTVLGLIVALSGGTIGGLLQNKEFLIALSVLFIAMGLSMLGLYNLQLPPSVAAKLQGTGNRGGFFGAFLLGVSTGVVASPCGSPVLVSILTLAGQGGEPGLGAVMLFTYALGIGMLFLVLGAFPAFLNKVPKSGVWMEDVKKFLGLVLIIASFYYLALALPTLLVLGMLIATCLIFAAFIGIKSKDRGQWPRLQWGWRLSAVALTAVALYVGFALVPDTLRAETATIERRIANAEKRGHAAGAAAATAETTDDTASSSTLEGPPDEWLEDETTASTMANANGWPMIIDFGAEWCAACKELEHKTFSDDGVKEALSGYVKLYVDGTEETEQYEELSQRYGVVSLPTVIFLNSDGEEIPNTRLLQFEPPAKFLQRVEKAAQ